MQQSQRARCNHALEYAAQRANAAGVPLVVGFGVMDDYPEANVRHYRFMLEGLAETQRQLARRGVQMIVRHGHPADIALQLGAEATVIVCDRGHLRHQRQWRKHVARKAACRVVEIESDVVVPVEVASNKAEHAARTLRPKLHRHLPDYLVDLRPTPVRRDSLELRPGGIDLATPEAVETLLECLAIDRSVPPTPWFRGGPGEARRRLRRFLENELAYDPATRDQPDGGGVSQMSPYLHFGQISPIEIALAVQRANLPPTARDAYLEQLIVRRELAHNFVWFTRDYEKFTALPGWARRTLEAHADDPREHRYTRRQLETAKTHDPYWNAAMREMRLTGYMHNRMRMYWGKKILEWTASPRHAHRTALTLNNRYFLDGRDPNSYANVGWIFGLHDRPWTSRPIFGNVRWMSAGGLERKFDVAAYVESVNRLEAGALSSPAR